MGKRLSDNLSSLYIGAANRLKPKKARRKIVAYVESYDDVSFWRTLLGEFEDDTRYFEVMLPSKTTLAKGKKSVLMNELGSQLGQNMIACVDSDYDYLLQGATHTSRYIINNKYVFHTYAYAIVSVYRPERSLENMSRRVRRKLQELEHRHPKAIGEIEAMKEEFAQLGVYPDNTYMFIQGHHIMDSVVMKLLTPVCNVLRREREAEIKELAEHDMQFHNELTSYQRRQLGVDIVLRKHTSYKESPLYKRLESDIRRFLKHID